MCLSKYLILLPLFLSKADAMSPIDIAELAKVYQGVTKENCFTQDMLLKYDAVLEERIVELEKMLQRVKQE